MKLKITPPSASTDIWECIRQNPAPYMFSSVSVLVIPKKCINHFILIIVHVTVGYQIMTDLSHSNSSRHLGVSGKCQHYQDVITPAQCTPSLWRQADVQENRSLCSWRGGMRLSATGVYPTLTWNDKLEWETMLACCQSSCKRGNGISRRFLELYNSF